MYTIALLSQFCLERACTRVVSQVVSDNVSQLLTACNLNS
jgi:hypothetical protein